MELYHISRMRACRRDREEKKGAQPMHEMCEKKRILLKITCDERILTIIDVCFLLCISYKMQTRAFISSTQQLKRFSFFCFHFCAQLLCLFTIHNDSNIIKKKRFVFVCSNVFFFQFILSNELNDNNCH